MRDISDLETFGVKIEVEDFHLCGTLSILSLDNLAAHVALGYAENCNSKYPCRICEEGKTTCQKSTREDALKLRTIHSYNEQLNIIASSSKIDFGKTKGIKRDCALNMLPNFHVLENQCLDIMHDITEGCMGFLLKDVLQHCISKKVIKESEVNQKIFTFNYGKLDSHNIPSHVVFEKSNLNQNASQMKCLFENIPFILWDYQNRDPLKDIWLCVESLLKISQILFSYVITEEDICRLEKEIHEFLLNIQIKFKINLKYKHHNLVHYPNYIRKMGPPVHTSMLRFEAKHKCFKDFAKNMYNHKNVLKSLALHHQQQMSLKTNSFVDTFSHGVLHRKQISEELGLIISNHFDISTVQYTNFFKANNYKYNSGILLLKNSCLFEIQQIFISRSEVYFLAIKYEFIDFHSFSNSLKIRKTDPCEYVIIPYKQISYKTPYEANAIGDERYLKANTLELKTIYDNQ